MRTRALLKAFRSRLFTEVPDAAIHSETLQTFVMLRPAASNEWSCFVFYDSWYDHCAAKRRVDVRFFAELTAEDFSAIGDTLSLPYGGTFRHGHGEIAFFAWLACLVLWVFSWLSQLFPYFFHALEVSQS